MLNTLLVCKSCTQTCHKDIERPANHSVIQTRCPAPVMAARCLFEALLEKEYQFGVWAGFFFITSIAILGHVYSSSFSVHSSSNTFVIGRKQHDVGLRFSCVMLSFLQLLLTNTWPPWGSALQYGQKCWHIKKCHIRWWRETSNYCLCSRVKVKPHRSSWF